MTGSAEHLTHPPPGLDPARAGEPALRLESLQERLRATGAALQEAISCREAAEVALRRSEARLASVFHASPVAASITTPDEGRFVDVNAALLQLLGYQRAALIGRTSAELSVWVQPDDRAAVVRDLRARGVVHGLETRFRMRSGEVRDVLGFFQLVDFGAGASEPFLLSMFHDITDHKRRDAERARLASIVESSDRAIVSMGIDGTVTSWNRAAEQLYGYSSREMVGQPIERIVPPGLVAEFWNTVDSLLSGERVNDLETVRLRKRGQPIGVALAFSPVRDDHGATVGVSIIARDTGAERRAQAALRRAYNALELDVERQLSTATLEQGELEHGLDVLADQIALRQRAADAFISMVSHELRSPLGVVKGHATTLLLGSSQADTSAQRRSLLAIVGACDELEGLVEDLLDLSRIRAGAFAVQPRPVQLDQLIRMAARQLRGAGFAFRLRVDVAAGVPRVMAEPRRIVQVLRNLMENACKYSRGTAHIDVTVAVQRRRVQVAVADLGIGILAADLEHVFDRFRRGANIQVQAGAAAGGPGHGGHAGTASGAGLGLAVAKGIVEAHGGTIEAVSPVPDRPPGATPGALFRFTLPAAPPADPRRRERAAPAAG